MKTASLFLRPFARPLARGILSATLAFAGLTAAHAQFTGIDDATPTHYQLDGATKDDGWYNLSASPKDKTVDGVTQSILGLSGYPTALASSPRWNSPVASQLQSDASHKAAFNKISNGNGSSYIPGYDSTGTPNGLASFNPDGTPVAGAVWKRANGTAGADGFGPIPSGDSLYAISFSNVPNTRQGTVGIFEANPVEALQNVVLQLEIGSANGYDFYNHSVDGIAVGALDSSTAFPQLRLTLANSTVVTLLPGEAQLIARGFNGVTQMPTGPNGELQDEAIYINQYGFQWDLSAYSDIASFNVTWTGVEHSQLYAMRLQQSDSFNEVFSAIPEPSTMAFGLLGVIAVAAHRRRTGTLVLSH